MSSFYANEEELDLKIYLTSVTGNAEVKYIHKNYKKIKNLDAKKNPTGYYDFGWNGYPLYTN